MLGILKTETLILGLIYKVKGEEDLSDETNSTSHKRHSHSMWCIKLQSSYSVEGRLDIRYLYYYQ